MDNKNNQNNNLDLNLDLDFEIKNLINNNGLMSYNQYYTIANIIKKNNGCNLLVFGLGNDSFLWNKLNYKGFTLFIEDNMDWINQINKLENNNKLNIYHHQYTTKIQDWKKYYTQETNYTNDKLLIKILGYENVKWDIIIVDAPVGHPFPCRRNTVEKKCNLCPCPGRMSSIYTASKLITNNNDNNDNYFDKIVIVDDYSRDVEKSFSNKYLYKNSNKSNKVIENKLAVFHF